MPEPGPYGEYRLPAHPPAPGPVPPWPLTSQDEQAVIAQMTGTPTGDLPDGNACSTPIPPGKAPDAGGLRDAHPYVHLAYGPWEPSGHQCGDLQSGGCDDVPPERKVTARYNGLGEKRFVGWELGDCPSCGQGASGDLREQLAEALTREHYRRASERIETSVEDHCAGFADAVLPVVEAWAAEQVRIREVEIDEDIITPERALHEQTIKRAEEAERQRDEALAAAERVRELHTRHDCTNHAKASTPVPCVNHGICKGCGVPPGYPCRTLAVLDQPKESDV